MTQGTRRLFIVITVGMAALALGAGAVRPAPARAATGSYVALGDAVPAFVTASFHTNLAGNEQLAQVAWLAEQAATVPSVVGLSTADAVSAIRSAGLVPNVLSMVDTSCDNIGYVIEQIPLAGARRATGSSVIIRVGVKPPVCHPL